MRLPPQILGDGTGTDTSAEDRGAPVLAGCSNLLPIGEVALANHLPKRGKKRPQRAGAKVTP